MLVYLCGFATLSGLPGIQTILVLEKLVSLLSFGRNYTIALAQPVIDTQHAVGFGL